MSAHLPTDNGFVYFIASSGLIRIGFTDNVRNRFYAIRAASPVSVELMGWIEAVRADESAWHARFSSIRHHAEWFTETPELLASIRTSLADATANRFNGQQYRKQRALMLCQS